MKIKEIRLNNRISSEEMANLLKISVQAYYKYENGKAEPSIDSLIKIANRFHTTIDELVGRNTDMINLNTLEPEVSTLIKKIIKMNNMQKAQTINFVGALTMFDE